MSQGLTPTTNNWYCAFVGKNTSFVLDEHYSAFIDGEIAAGRYRSASEVIRSALRLLEDRETQLARFVRLSRPANAAAARHRSTSTDSSVVSGLTPRVAGE